MIVCFAIVCTLSFQAYAGPPPPPPPHPHHHPHHYHGCRPNSGVRLAADIVSLVGASLAILRGPAAAVPVVPAAQPVPMPGTGYYPPAVPCYQRYNNGYVPGPPVIW